jgi:hypothetical protein
VREAIERETGRKLQPLVGPRRAGDPSILIADPTAANADLKFFRSIPISPRSSLGVAIAFEGASKKAPCADIANA